jgi:protease-4
VTETIEKRSTKEVWFWRIAFISTMSALFFLHSDDKEPEIKQDCIVKTRLYGEIRYDDSVLSRIGALRDNLHVKGVLLQIDSPGGEVTASESLHKAFKSLKEKKPLFVSVQSAAASGGYMAAMPADRIFAYETSAVGSIGVIAYGFEVTDLAEKIGVKLLNYKSSPLKGIPNIFEKTSEEGNRSIQGFVNEMDSIFKEMVQTNRPLIKNLDSICNGEIYSGRQGIENGLVDEIGTETEALAALQKKTSSSWKVVDYELMTGQNSKMEFFSSTKKIIKTIAELL